MVSKEKIQGESKRGRPKGRKSGTGIPPKGIKEAIILATRAYEKGKDKLMSFSEMSQFMSLQKGSDITTIGALKDYGLIEQSSGGWAISKLGICAIKGEKEAVRTAFEGINIFRELSSQFNGKEVSIGVIEDYIKKKYKKGENVKIIAQRFSEGMDYIKSFTEKAPPVASKKEVNAEIITLIKLKYALTPSSEVDIAALAEGIYAGFKDYPNDAVRIIAENIQQNKENREALKALVESLVSIVTK